MPGNRAARVHDPASTPAHGSRAADGLSRIVYLVQVTPSARDYARFGITALAERGVAIEILDVMGWLHPRLRDRIGDAPPHPRISVHRIARAGDLSACSKTISAADFAVVNIAYDGSVAALESYRSLSRLRVPYLVLSNNSYPGQARALTAGLFDRVRDFWQRLRDGEVKLTRSLLRRIPLKLVGVSAPALIVYGGRNSRAGATLYPVGPTTRAIYLHSSDYEMFREIASARTAAAERHIAFIDEHVGFDVDYIGLGVEWPIRADLYYAKLRQLFDRLERDLGMPIVVAANPRADYSRDQPFGGRRIVHGETAKLVATASLVLAHRSTAIGFAVMARRPVALIALRDQYLHWTQRYAIDGFAAALGTKVRFFDDPEKTDLSAIFDVSGQCYDRYMTDYVKTSEGAEAPMWERIADEMAAYLREHR